MPATMAKGMTLLLLLGLSAAPSLGGEVARLRRPVAVVASPDGSRLYVANARSGSLSMIDPASGRVVAEHDVARGLTDLAWLPGGRLAAIDREGGALLVLKLGDGPVEVESKLSLTDQPASVLASPDGSICVVASTASHRLSVFSLPTDGSRGEVPKLVRSIALPFPPALLAWLEPGSKLAAADAFGGRIAVVHPARDAPDSIRSIPAHNIRGIVRTPDGRSLVVSHQTSSKLARSSFEDVHWGSLLANHLRVLSIRTLLDPKADLLEGSRLIDLGRPGRAAGDPGALAIDRRGRVSVALAGVQEVAFLADLSSSKAQRASVGQGPSAIALSPDGALAYVADSLDDSITVIDVETAAKARTIPLGPRPDLGPVERGERLFADARLSHDGWMSCRSCHADGQAGVLSVDTMADGGFGAPKRVPSLLGVATTAPWTWLGTVDRLEDQARKSIETTMRGKTPAPEQVHDLTAYLRSLQAPRPSPMGEAERRGLAVFQARKCAECHAPPEYTNERTFDVGLVDEVGHRKFNPPSLRGVGDRSPYLHDGRAATLPDVFLRHRHPRDSTWSPAEVDDLSAFLKSL